MPKHTIWIGAAVGVLACAAIAWAQEKTKQATVYQTIGGQAVFELLASEGYKPTLGKDSDGDPKITFKLQSKTIGVFFYDCKKTQFCGSLSVSTGWDLKTPLNADKLMAYNYDTRYVRASVDTEKDPYLESDYDLDGGVTKESVLAWIQMYADQLADFRSTFKL